MISINNVETLFNVKMEIKRNFKIINDFEHEINKIIYVLRSVCLMEIKPSYLNLLM